MNESKRGANGVLKGPGGPPRQPYDKPRVAWEEALEQKPSLMAVCTKSGSDDACNSGPGAS